MQAVPTLELLQLGEMGRTPAAAAAASYPTISQQQQQQHQGPGSDGGAPGGQYIDFKALLQVFRTAQLRSYQMYVVQRQPPPLIPTGASGVGVTFGGGPGAGVGAMDGSWAMAAGGGGMAVAAVGRGVGGSAGGAGEGWQEQQGVMGAPGGLGAGGQLGMGVEGAAEGAQQVQVQQLEQRFEELQVQVQQGGLQDGARAEAGDRYAGYGEWEGQGQAQGQVEEDGSPQAQMEAVQAAEVTQPEQQGQGQEAPPQLLHGRGHVGGQQGAAPLGQTGYGQGQGQGQRGGQEVDLLMLLGDEPSQASFRQHTPPPAFGEQDASFAGGGRGGGGDDDVSS